MRCKIKISEFVSFANLCAKQYRWEACNRNLTSTFEVLDNTGDEWIIQSRYDREVFKVPKTMLKVLKPRKRRRKKWTAHKPTS